MLDIVIRMGIAGGGQNSLPVIRGLAQVKNFRIIGVADEHQDAPGRKLAREIGIKEYDDAKTLLHEKGLQVVIETTDSPALVKTLETCAPPGVKILDGATAQLFLGMARERERLLKVETAYKLSRQYSKLLEETNQKMDERLLELSLLNDAAKTFSSALDRTNISVAVSSILNKKIDHDIFAVLLTDGDECTLILDSGKKLSKDTKDEIQLRMMSLYASESKAPVDPEQVSVVERAAGLPTDEPVSKWVRSFSAAPLVVSGKVLGVMGIASYDKRCLSAEDESFFQILTTQLALFVENDRIKQDITNERNRLESILKEMTSALIVTDRQGRVVLANRMTKVFLGIENDKVLGKDVYEAIPQEKVAGLFDMVAKQKNEFFSTEIDLVSPADESVRIMKAHLAKVRDHLGKKIGVVLVLEDVTEAKAVDQMKSEFISVASHELRTPLASIREAVSIIYDGTAGQTNANQKKFLSLAERNIDRLAGLIDDLLDLSKIESGKLTLKRSRVDFNALAGEAIGTFAPLAREKRVHLKTDFCGELPAIDLDRDRIIQIMANLLSNALKFTPPGGTVTLKTALDKGDGGHIHVTVLDTGVGIKDKDLGKLFQKFQQVDSSMTRKVGGTGLGLSISKQIVELHGGKIWAEPGKEKGSAFHFILPVGEAKNISRQKILVVDDEVDLCTMIRERLKANDFSVCVAHRGQEALEKVKSEKPDLIILDLMMPEMDGFEVCSKLKRDAHTSAIPVIVLTALKQEDAARRALSMGAQGYLVKPFQTEALLFTIREFLEKQEGGESHDKTARIAC